MNKVEYIILHGSLTRYCYEGIIVQMCKDEGIKIIENIGITIPDDIEYNYYMY